MNRTLVALLFAARLILAQAADTSAPVHNVDGSFVREWLVLGPIPSKEVEVDFLAEAGGEANVRPKEGDTVVTRDGTQFIWTRLRAKRDLVDLEQALGICDWSIAYAYCELNSDQSIQTDLRASSAIRSPLWLNGV